MRSRSELSAVRRAPQWAPQGGPWATLTPTWLPFEVKRCTKLDRFYVAAARESLYQANFFTSLGTIVVTISLAFGAVGSMSLDGLETPRGQSHCVVFVQLFASRALRL